MSLAKTAKFALTLTDGLLLVHEPLDEVIGRYKLIGPAGGIWDAACTVFKTPSEGFGVVGVAVLAVDE